MTSPMTSPEICGACGVRSHKAGGTLDAVCDVCYTPLCGNCEGSMDPPWGPDDDVLFCCPNCHVRLAHAWRVGQAFGVLLALGGARP
jgi:hypothetical protein